MLNNFIGLFPYIFTSSTHFIFRLSMSLPLWLGHMVWSSGNQVEVILVHLTPLGTPGILQPFIVVIELVRNIIRPFTLRIRLRANMIAGHLILTLIGSQAFNTNFLVFFLLMLVVVLVLLLECAVAIIQAYVFSILRTLYVKELDSCLINKI
jgi:F-type H+-transporting ATPase subunit a